jgi:phenylacetate-CoA ligase
MQEHLPVMLPAEKETRLLTRLYTTLYMAYHRLGQARYPYRPLTQIIADRDRRARQMVAYAYRYVPYYRETMNRLGLRPEDFRTADDLARLPIIERAQLQRDPEYYAASSRGARALTLRNSGSTGRPCVFFFDERVLLQDAAYGERGRAPLLPLLRKSMGYRLTSITSPSSSGVKVQNYVHGHAWLPRGVALQKQTLSLFDPPEMNTPLINAFRPDVIQSYGSYLAALFAYVKSTGAPFHRPRLIRQTSDPLPEAARRMIEEELGIPVFGRYEAVEMPNIAFECEAHRGMHINLDLCALRIADGEGRTLPIGESGEVIVSNLLNRGTVFLNYRLGDIATLSAERCSCGRNLPLLARLDGRRDDWLELPSGKRLHPGAVTVAFKQKGGIWQWQVVQEDARRFSVSLVVDPQSDQQETRAQVAETLGELFGEGCEIEVRFVEAIPRTPGGKVRPVISLATRERLGS